MLGQWSPAAMSRPICRKCKTDPRKVNCHPLQHPHEQIKLKQGKKKRGTFSPAPAKIKPTTGQIIIILFFWPRPVPFGGSRHLRLTRLPRHDRGPVHGGNRSAASCLCTVPRRALYGRRTFTPIPSGDWVNLTCSRAALEEISSRTLILWDMAMQQSTYPSCWWWAPKVMLISVTQPKHL